MNSAILDLCGDLVSSTYMQQSVASRNSVSALVRNLLAQRRIPDEGWGEEAIELFLREVSLWDSNNFPSQAGVGEREGRCLSKIVSRRHWKLIHGIGRSGDVNAEQPKAAGSSFLLTLTKLLVRDAIKNVFGICNVPSEVVVLPVATGMAIMLGMTAISQSHYPSTIRKHVIWSRIDQKSCIKAMTADPSLIIHVVEQVYTTVLQTDVEKISALIDSLGADTIHSIVLTTSTFAPRSPDDVPSVSKLCKTNNIPLLVNNAYGLQCSKCCHLVSEGMRIGRVDLVVQSTDKNFLVPVGGSILFGPLAERVNSLYPGRASLSPILDLLITLLEIGRNQLKTLLRERMENYQYLRLQLLKSVELSENPKNSVSLTIRVTGDLDHHLGSSLFLRNVSGCRFFKQTDRETKFGENFKLKNFGCHSNQPVCEKYLNAACAMGMTRAEIDRFILTLNNLEY